jgi:hypothetical protein
MHLENRHEVGACQPHYPAFWRSNKITRAITRFHSLSLTFTRFHCLHYVYLIELYGRPIQCGMLTTNSKMDESPSLTGLFLEHRFSLRVSNWLVTGAVNNRPDPVNNSPGCAIPSSLTFIFL